MEARTAYGHYAALITVLIWGTTFVSTKVLLSSFMPIEILFIRFTLGFIALLPIPPHGPRPASLREEALYALAGLTGICLYYLLENIALTYTMASNVGVIVSASPFFTALLSHFIGRKDEGLTPRFIAGFLAAIGGIALISINGSAFELNPRGDLLALLAAAIWAVYSLATRKISASGCNVIQATRRIFLYGLIFMLPVLLLSDTSLDIARLASPAILLNMLYLGFGASALCFLTWNYSVSVLGAVRTSAYLYLVPVITIAFSALVLSEPVTPLMVLGTALTLAGLMLSQGRKSS